MNQESSIIFIFVLSYFLRGHEETNEWIILNKTFIFILLRFTLVLVLKCVIDCFHLISFSRLFLI